MTSPESALKPGIAMLQMLADDGRYVFTTADATGIAADLGLSGSATHMLLSRLCRAGWIERLRRGLYAGTGRLPGGVDINAFAVGAALASPSAISHWSALSFHHLTEQIPRVVMVSTPRRVPPIGIKSLHGDQSPATRWTVLGISFEIVKIAESQLFGVEQVWVDDKSRVPITDRERTVLDLFVSPRLFGGLDRAIATVHDYHAELDIDRLVEHGVRFGSKAVCARLGWTLTQVGVDAARLEPLRQGSGPGLQVLDPTRRRRGRIDSTWHLLDNVSPRT
jgi:predicted transcriptional regulator of viral defense system